MNVDRVVRRVLSATADRGLTTPEVRRISRVTSAAVQALAPVDVLCVADMLFSTTDAAARLVGAEVVARRPDVLQRLEFRRLNRWARTCDSWGAVDALGVTLAGVAWREGRISDAVVLRWTLAPSRWLRRLALVATVPLNARSRGGTGDHRRTLRVCHQLMDDRDPLVIGALSWALRELAKRRPASVSTFVTQYHGRLASRVVKEVRSKIATGRKAGPLRTAYGRYNNFFSDFMASNPRATRTEVGAAWQKLKALDLPKTYGAWLRYQRKSAGARRPPVVSS